MTRYSITIGDWSGDGHDKKDRYLIEVPDKFTEEVLGANWHKNVALIGFGPDSFAEEYEDATIPRDKYNRLVAAGLDSHDLIASEDIEEDDEDGKLYLSSQGMLKIVLFYFGHGLEEDGFEVSIINDDATSLIGGWSKVTGTKDSPYGIMVGYGLYY